MWQVIRAGTNVPYTRDDHRRHRERYRPQHGRLRSESCTDVLIKDCDFSTGDDASPSRRQKFRWPPGEIALPQNIVIQKIAG